VTGKNRPNGSRSSEAKEGSLAPDARRIDLPVAWRPRKKHLWLLLPRSGKERKWGRTVAFVAGLGRGERFVPITRQKAPIAQESRKRGRAKGVTPATGKRENDHGV